MVSEAKLGGCVFKLVKLQPSLKTATADRACAKANGKLAKAKGHAGITTITRRKARKASRKGGKRKGRKAAARKGRKAKGGKR